MLNGRLRPPDRREGEPGGAFSRRIPASSCTPSRCWQRDPKNMVARFLARSFAAVRLPWCLRKDPKSAFELGSVPPKKEFLKEISKKILAKTTPCSKPLGPQ